MHMHNELTPQMQTHAFARLEIGWGKRVQVELTREPGTSFGVCIVGGTVCKSSIIYYTVHAHVRRFEQINIL